MSIRQKLISDILAGISGFSAVTAWKGHIPAMFGLAGLMHWQEQLDWFLRIVAALVAITAGSVALYQRLKKHEILPLD
jgi:hypothetical protein